MIKKHIYLPVILIFAFSCRAPKTVVVAGSPDPFKYSITKTKVVSNGAVISAHPLASEVGLMILKQGGNAIDAAIATQLALAVVYPGAGNIGGGGFLVATLANGKNLAIDYREKAPAAAGRDMYLDKDGNAITGLSQNGHLAAGIPGTVAGLFASHKYGKLSFAKLVQPAIDLAEHGFVITAAEAHGLNGSQKDFARLNTITPVFVKAISWKPGDTLIQKDLARTLTRIRDNGKKGFYEGETAKLIVEEMKRANGIISLEDLQGYDAKEREAVVFDYKGYDVVTMPLPSSGGVLLPQMMNMVRNQPLAGFGFQTLQSVQLMTEVERRAYADRAEFLGDVDFYKVPVKTLTSESYALNRMKDYDPAKAGSSKQTGPGVVPQSEETTHLSVYDKEGNAVAVTTTLNGGYGSGTVVGGAGFLLNNEMDDFSVKPGVANMYGALGTAANAIAPGKRMLSSMTPTIVLKNKKPYIVVGTPGGTTITTSVFQSLINILEFKMSPEDAVNKPKFHHQWMPDVIDVEPGFSPEVITKLEAMGYKVTKRGPIGRTELIVIENGKITAVADRRGDDHVAAY